LCELFVIASAEFAVKFYVTHLAIDEVEKISVDRDDRRQALLQVLAQLPADRIATSTLVLGISWFDEARFGSDLDAEDFRRLTGGNVRHAEDVMLALTARSIGATVVSEDDDLRRMAGKLAINWITTGQLQQALGQMRRVNPLRDSLWNGPEFGYTDSGTLSTQTPSDESDD
jgi:predicted nucleic acid-binding protein